MIRTLLKGLLYAEWDNSTDDCTIRCRKNLSDIFDALSDINFAKNSVISVKHLPGFMESEYIVSVDGVSVFGVVISTTGYYWNEYTSDPELIQETLNEVYFFIDKKRDKKREKDKEDAVRAKDTLRQHQKYSRPWLYD